jgi:hypothetical protein
MRKKKRLWTLFISYYFGGHYCGVYPSIEDVKAVVGEMAQDMEIPKKELMEVEIPGEESWDFIDDFFHEFNDGTWIHVQEVSPPLVENIFKNS